MARRRPLQQHQLADDSPDLSQAERERRRAETASFTAIRAARKLDMLCLKRLLTRLQAETEFILREVHGDDWDPERWYRWVFPCPTADGIGGDMRVTHLTAAAFLDADVWWWREILERIVGMAEHTKAGICALFTPTQLLRVDAFAMLFAAVPRRKGWFIRLIQRLRVLRDLGMTATASGPSPPDEHHAGKRLRAMRAGFGLPDASDIPFASSSALGQPSDVLVLPPSHLGPGAVSASGPLEAEVPATMPAGMAASLPWTGAAPAGAGEGSGGGDTGEASGAATVATMAPSSGGAHPSGTLLILPVGVTAAAAPAPPHRPRSLAPPMGAGAYQQKLWSKILGQPTRSAARRK